MDKKEAAVRDVFAIWGEGPRGAIDAWQKHGAEGLIWWNSARGQIDGLEACLAKCDEMYEALGIHHIGVPVRRLAVDDTCVYTERVDELYRELLREAGLPQPSAGTPQTPASSSRRR